MKRRLAFILSLIIALVLCVPSVSVSADSQFKVYTTDSVDGYYSGTFQGQNGSVDISSEVGYLYRVSSDSLVVTNYQDLYDKFPSSFFESDYWFIYNGSVDGSSISFYGVSFEASSPVSCVFGSGAFTGLYCGSLNSFVMSFYSYDSNSDSFIVSSTQNSSTPSGYQYQGIQVTTFNTQLYSLLDFYNVPFYCNIEWGTYSQYDPFTGMMSSILMHDNEYGFTNFADINMDYYNGSEIVSPGDNILESNSNHLYLSNFDAGYCKPYHMVELYRAGGGYLYFTYDFDSWINSHSDDYQLQVITQLNVDGTATTYNSLWPLDLQGCLVLPFNRLASSYQWADENILFIEYEDESLFSNYNKGYVYAINYLKYVDPNTQKGIRSMGNGRTRSFVSSNGSTHRLIGDDPAEENYFSGNSNHTQFLMSVTVRMVDNVSGDVSGSFTKTFNLLNGVSTVSNNQIRDNTNPYEPTSDDLYFPVIDSGGGYGLSGGNNQLVNFQFPSDIELFIDNGFKQFLAWYETSADTAYVSNRFWSNMGIFEENPAIPLYSTYFGFLPDDFKSIIFGCAGIGIIGGAFCILRRRLH